MCLLLSLHLNSVPICHVIRLALHLKDQQPIVFAENVVLEDVLSRQRHTTLTGWFVGNLIFASARDLTHTNFTDKFAWDKTDREWKERVKEQGTVIGRVYSAHPGEGDRYSLKWFSITSRAVPVTRKSALFRITVCGTFKEAARRRGLLKDDQESDDCLTAAAISEVPAQLRQLFVTILLFNEPSDRLALWNKHKISLSEDHLFKTRILASNLDRSRIERVLD